MQQDTNSLLQNNIDNTPPPQAFTPPPQPPVDTPAPASSQPVNSAPLQNTTTPIVENVSNFSLKAFLATVNWVEISFGIVGATALFYTIYYYKYKIQIDAIVKNDLQKQIDELNYKLQNEIKNNTQSLNNDGTFI